LLLVRRCYRDWGCICHIFENLSFQHTTLR
jgi:hypothetical protein